MNASPQRWNSDDDDPVFIRCSAEPLISGSQNNNPIFPSSQGKSQIPACRRCAAPYRGVLVVDQQVGCHETKFGVRGSEFGAWGNLASLEFSSLASVHKCLWNHNLCKELG